MEDYLPRRVGELPAETQIACFVFCRSMSLSVCGGTRRIRADVRVIAATTVTCRPPSALGPSVVICFIGLFVFPIEIPSLRDEVMTSLCWWNTSSIATRENWQEHKACQQEDAGTASVLSLARKHTRIAECRRAFGHTLRNGDFLDRRKLVAAAAALTLESKQQVELLGDSS